MARADDSSTSRDSDDAVGDALDLLTRDHHLAQGLFAAFEQAAEQQLDPLARRLCKLLRVHAQIEEEIFYPVTRRAIQDDILIDEAQREHEELERTIARVESMTSDHAEFRDAVALLREQTAQHIREEETHIFAQLRASGVNLVSLGRALVERRDTLLDTLGLHIDDEVGVANLRGVQ
ncbi:MAG TPA: hemerythrin domain-containing protein [Steroidobacter sp.]|jgi:hemerythrin-like domain-containing protein|nr:hemerythrin domain-containing protein [Steroidobacteraceae bacterium]HLS82658.1 hemerythrin domain-containing protein [Steroidobacter sp.]